MGVKKIFYHNLVLLLHIYKFEIEPRRSKRARVENDFGPDYYVFNIEENPQNLKEALTSPNAIF